MKPTSKVLLLLALLIILAFAWLNKFNFIDKKAAELKNIYDATYTINGEKITLKNSISEIPIPNSSTKIVTTYFGNDATADLDNDGNQDLVFLVTQETGGTGIFFYVVALLNTKDGPVGSQGLFIGDRIAPQNISVGFQNLITINYADRNPDESFAAEPSVGKSLRAKLNLTSMQIVEAPPSFQGNIDPSKIKLNTKKWFWKSTIYNDGTKITPRNDASFSLTFGDNGTFSASTDCNGVGGEYTVDVNKITFEKMMSTLMYCEGSQENEFSQTLSNVVNYSVTTDGELILGLKNDIGAMIFR